MFPIALLAALAAGALAQESTETVTTPETTETPSFHTPIFPGLWPPAISGDALSARALAEEIDDAGVSITFSGAATTTFSHPMFTEDWPSIATVDALAARDLAQGTITIVPSPPTGTPTDSPDGHTLLMPTNGAAPPNQMVVDAIGYVEDGYVGSIKKADECKTTLVLGCAETANPNMMCGMDSKFKATMTVGPNDYRLQFSEKYLGKKYTMAQSCILDDRWARYGYSPEATCLYSVKPKSATYFDVSENTSKVMIAITGGAKKLPTGNAICTSTDSGASPTGILEIKKIVVPLVLAAGAQALL